MKKLYCLPALFFVYIVCNAQTQYYWSGGQKIRLDTDSSQMIVGFDNEQKLQDFAAITPQASPVVGKSIALVDVRDNNVRQKVSAEKSIKNKIFAHKFSGSNATFYLTGDIILQPKDGIMLQTILSRFPVNGQIVKETSTGIIIVRMDNWSTIIDLANSIYESELVDWCHPDFITIIERTTSDPLFNQQYYLKNTGQNNGKSGIDINVEPAWAITKSTGNISVAVIDDGVEEHEDLSGRVLQGYTPLNPTGYGKPTTQTGPTIGHGVACAGIIAASHNTLGIAGIAPNVRIVPVNIFHSWIYSPIYQQYVSDESVQDIATAIEYAWNSSKGNADIISNSWRSPDADCITAEINNALTKGRGGKGCVVVFAAGNNNASVSYPASLSNVIAVGAISQCGTRKRSSNNWLDLNSGVQPDPSGVSCDGEKWWGSNYGDSLDVVAPGVKIYTTDRQGSAGYNTLPGTVGNYYSSFNGTSAACPHVAGVAALKLL